MRCNRGPGVTIGAVDEQDKLLLLRFGKDLVSHGPHLTRGTKQAIDGGEVGRVRTRHNCRPGTLSMGDKGRELQSHFLRKGVPDDVVLHLLGKPEEVEE